MPPRVGCRRCWFRGSDQRPTPSTTAETRDGRGWLRSKPRSHLRPGVGKKEKKSVRLTYRKVGPVLFHTGKIKITGSFQDVRGTDVKCSLHYYYSFHPLLQRGESAFTVKIIFDFHEVKRTPRWSQVWPHLMCW